MTSSPDGASPQPRSASARPLAEFWQRDRYLSVLQGLLVLHVFVMVPLRALYRGTGFLQEVVFTLLLVTGAIELKGSRVTTLVAFAILAAELALRIGRTFSLGIAPAATADAVDVALLACLGAVVLLHALKPGPVSTHRLLGACSAYMLFGLAWGHAYELVATLSPGAFRGAIEPDLADSNFVYFSFVTLTTAGYGDITPVSPVARSLASAEALMGQLYPALLLGRMVALHAEWSRNHERRRE
jgi:hypothetical protein